MIATLIAGAGAGTRMRGGDKLLETVAGRPLLRLLVERAAVLGPVLVTLPDADTTRATALVGTGAKLLKVHTPDGMSASLRAGALACPPGHGLLVLPGDMPEISRDDLARMAETASRWPEAILRGTSGGTPGHPVLFPASLLSRFSELSGDTGARPILAAHRDRIRPVALPGRHALTDLDTPEAWRDWRRATA